VGDGSVYQSLPEYMRESARLYVEEHRLPGDFLQAVLCNDLVGAFGRADLTNRAAMGAWAQWLYNECPHAAWGSREKVEAWVTER